MAGKRATYELQPRIGWRAIGNEVIVFNCSNQRIVIWNQSASLLWYLIREKCEQRVLIEVLGSAYGIERDQAKKGVDSFIKELRANGFLALEETGSNTDEQDQGLSPGEEVLLAVEMRAIEERIPFAATFELTYACNERCRHCYMERGLPSLPLAAVKRILTELANEGCLFITFTGGEVFARPDALEIIEYAASLHFAIDVLSNGTLISESIADQLSQLPVRRVQLSLYGACAKTHDDVTLIQGSFQATMHAVELLRARNVKVEFAFTLMNVNFPERYMVKATAESLDSVLSINPIVTARNSWARDTYDFRLTDEQMQTFLGEPELTGLYAGRKPFAEHQLYFGFSDIKGAPPCYSGFNSCAVTPVGKVLPCNQLLFEVGDLTVSSFHEIWRNSPQLAMLRNLTVRSLNPCSTCGYLPRCARCPGLALLEGGGLLGSSPENCRITKLTQIASRERSNR